MIELNPAWPTENELNLIIGWLNDPVLMKYSEQRHLKHIRELQETTLRVMYGPPWNYQKILCNGVLVGTISARTDQPNSVADVGILIGAEYIGRGHGCAAWRIFCDQLAKDGIRKIEGGCMAQNKAMLRVFEKNGMRLEGTRRSHFQTGKNEYDDMVLYGKLT